MKSVAPYLFRVGLGRAAILALLLSAPVSALEFEEARFFSAGVNPYQLAIADYNNDDLLDVAVTNSGVWSRGSGSLTILLGDGAGNLTPGGSYITGIISPGVVAGDLNGDGWVDVVVVNRQPYVGYGTLSVFLNIGDGSGSMSLAHTIPCGSQPMHADLGYLNGDSVLDIAVAVHGSSQVRVFLGNGIGGFAERFPRIETPRGTNGIAIGNLDSITDSTPDIVTSSWWGNSTSVILDDGVGAHLGPVNYPIGQRSWTVDTIDVNGDGLEDIVSPSALDSTVSVLLGDGTGEFAGRIVTDLKMNAYDFTVADVDLDREVDFVTGQSGFGIKLFLGDGSGNFLTPAVPYPMGPNSSSAFPCVRVADFNDDGFPDLVATEPATNNGLGSVSLYLQVPNDRPIPVIEVDSEVIGLGYPFILDGTGSTDLEGDPMNYQWTILDAPLGSVAELLDADSSIAGFTPDEIGVYTLSLSVSDYIGSGEAATVELLVLSLRDYAIFNIDEAIEVVCNLSGDDLLKGRRVFKYRLWGLLHWAKVYIFMSERSERRASKLIRSAIARLNTLESVIDGCLDRGEPDVRGSGYRIDWIQDCSAQEVVCAAVREARAALEDIP